MLQAISQKWRKPAVGLVSYSILIVGGLIFVLPFAWMILTSFKSSGEVFLPNLIPREPSLSAYQKVFQKVPLARWYLNTFLVAVVNVIAVAIGSALAGYGLSKYSYPGQGLVMLLILSTMMVPTEMLLIPWYVAAVKLGLEDTHLGIIFPGLVSASSVFIMRQFMQTLPDELLDAGRIDGMSELGLLWKIVLPLTKPALTTVCALTFMGNWNSYLWPLIVTTEPQMYVVQLGLALTSAAEDGGQANWAYTMALSTLISIPALIVFSMLHKQLVGGIVLTGLKG